MNVTYLDPLDKCFDTPRIAKELERIGITIQDIVQELHSLGDRI